MEAISLDGTDTIVAWKVEAQRPSKESTPNWLNEEAMEEVVSAEVREEEEDEEVAEEREKKGEEALEEGEATGEREVVEADEME